jgi:hypothetical protein
MDKIKLANALRDIAEDIRDQEVKRPGDADACELIRVLARVVEGKSLDRAFGAPGDWGYGRLIGDALAAGPEEG